MNRLRVLVVNTDSGEAERLAGELAAAQHMALPAAGLEEAAEALFVQKFDAVLLGCPLPSDGIAAFTAKLRALEGTQRCATPTPVLSVSQPPDGIDGCGCDMGIDGYVPDSFEPATLAEAITGLATAIGRTADAPAKEGSKTPVFEAEEFRAQVGFDEDLMKELIDLFLGESPCQVVEMRDALAAGNFERLARVAHTLKGSFATFHAAQARGHAQQLETASTAAGEAKCRELLSLLEHDLELLEPELLALRDGSGSR